MQEVPGRKTSVTAASPTPAQRRTPSRPPSRLPLAPPSVPLASPDLRDSSLLVDPPEAASGSIIERHEAAPPIYITHETTITGVTAEVLWETYYANFHPLRELAILQHCYTRDEVLGELANPRITKIVGWQDGTPVGLAMVTNSLEDVPQISPDFLRTNYPTHAENNSIYFGILVMVVPGRRGMTLFSRLSVELWQIPAKAGGILVYDICDFNRMAFDAETLSQRLADNFPDSSVKVIDRQTWYVAELPRPIPEAPARADSGS